MHTGFLLGNIKERDDLKDLLVEGMTILKWILEK